MAKQRYKTGLNPLSYAKSETPYVAPPTKEILGLLATRENDYLTTKNNINLAKEFQKNTPFNPISKPIYDEMINKIDTTLSSINPDNYADKSIDTEQLIHDAKYVFGGKELADQQLDFTTKDKQISETKNVRPEILDWKRKQLVNSLEPITVDENGKYVVPTAKSPKIVETRDLFKATADIVKDMKSSGGYVHNKDGTISIDKGVTGKYGITKTEFQDEKELYDTALFYLSKDPTNAEYLDDEAEFSLYKELPTPSSLANSMSPIAISTFFPDKIKKGKVVEPVTEQDILKYTQGNPAIFKALAKENSKFNQMDSVAQSMANIYGFSKEDKTFFEDIEYQEAARARARASAGASTDFEDTSGDPLVIVKPATTFVTASPVIFENLKANELKNQKAYVNAQNEYKALINEVTIDKAKEPHLRDLILESKEKLEKADAQIQYTRQAEANLTKSIIQVAKDNDIDVEKEYESSNNLIRKDVRDSNALELTKSGYLVNINNMINVTDNGKTGKIGDTSLPIYTKEYANNHKGKLSDFILKDGNNYSLASSGTAIMTNAIPTLTKKILESHNPSNFSSNPYSSDTKKINRNNIITYPKVEDFNTLVSKVFTNPDIDTSNFSPATVKKAKELATKMKKSIKLSDINVNQTLDYLYVDDQVKKGTAAYDLLRLGVSIDTTLKADANHYKVVNDSGQWEDLPLYLRSKGLTLDDIDYKELKSSVMLTSDREYGQKINMPLPLTVKGREALLKKDPHALDLSSTLNVTAVNYAGINSSFNKKLVDTVYSAYKESFNNRLPSGDQERKAYGLIAFDNSLYSKDFYDKNLYTMADGSSVKYTTPDNHKLVINAVKRSANPGRLGDNDFYLTKENEDIMVTNRTTGIQSFIPKEVYEADKGGLKYRKIMFASPEDIGALIGQNFMNIQAKQSNNKNLKNQQVKTTGESYEVSPDKIRSTEHSRTITNTRKTYGVTSKPYLIKDYKGNEVNINSRINPKELVSFYSEFPNQIENGVYAYMNKSVASTAKSIIKDYKLKITSMFRDENKNKNLEGAAKDSLHTYGKSLDAKYNDDSKKLLSDLQANPEMAKNLGISYAFKHVVDGVPHLHIDFI